MKMNERITIHNIIKILNSNNSIEQDDLNYE